MLVDSEHKVLAFIVRILDSMGLENSFLQELYEDMLIDKASSRM